MRAVLKHSGRQFTVQAGSFIDIDDLTLEEGNEVEFSDVLALYGDDDVTFGAPLVDGVSVTGTSLGQRRGPKIRIFKLRRRKNSRRRMGHRQNMTRVRIDRINAAAAE